ncbi:MAG: histidine phosphatase family protein, partial [Desulfurivibrio sp.]|nr:histidine phosphatase family protein [Desulfurivibrio sp.]
RRCSGSASPSGKGQWLLRSLYIRHGATEGDRSPTKGSIDVPLSALGKEAIAATAERLREHLANLAAAPLPVSAGRAWFRSRPATAATSNPGGDATPGPPPLCSPLDRAGKAPDTAYRSDPDGRSGLRERHSGSGRA